MEETIGILIAVGVILILGIVYLLITKSLQRQKQRRVNAKIEKRQQDLKYSLNKLEIPDCQIEKDLQDKILNSSVLEIKEMLQQQLFSSEQLLNLYTKRALKIGKELNLITDICYGDALEQVKKCDTLRKENPEQCTGDLFGVVVSIKESFYLKNYTTSVGCVSRIDNMAKEDGQAVTVLKNSGAIVFMKTNIPQGLLTYETMNHIYGETKNSWNPERTCGGSSGGEGSAVGSRISPLGLGSDIGGSIRAPCCFNGIAGLKPTAQRVSFKGHFDQFGKAMDGQITILPAIGPLGKYVSDINLMMKIYTNIDYYQNISRSQRDLYQTVSPWNEEIVNSKKAFKIAYFKSLSIFPACASSQRAVKESVEVLKKQGHEMVEIEFPFEKEIPFLLLRIFACDDGQGMIDLFGEEDPIYLYKTRLGLRGKPSWFPLVVSKILGCLKEKRISEEILMPKVQSAYEYTKITGEILGLRQKMIEFLDRQGIDAVLSSSFPLPAGKHGFSNDMNYCLTYLCMYNVLNFPAGVVPVTLVREDEQYYEDQHKDFLTKRAQEQMKDSKGLPIGVQIASYPMHEEIVCNIMKQIEEGVQFHQQHSYKY